MSLSEAELAFYRPAVGIMLLNRDRRVLVGRRIDMPAGLAAWQMPQGGIDPDIVVEAAKIAKDEKPADKTAKAGDKKDDKSAKAPEKKDDQSESPAEQSTIDPASIGTADDYQLARAVDMLRGIALFNGRLVN